MQPEWSSDMETTAVNATAVAPTAGQIITQTGNLPPGMYRVDVTGSYGGTADVIDNMQLFRGDKLVTFLPVIPVANASPITLTLPYLRILESQRLSVRAVAAGAAGSVYRGTIVATPANSADTA